MDKETIAMLDALAAKRRRVPTQEEIMQEPYSKSASILRAGGKISQSLHGYRERKPQIEMAKNVERAIMELKPAVLEAATGTGKSLAYIIPVVETGKVAIVSTANKALQDQLFKKDVPFVQTYVKHFDAALMKGIGNYLCLDRMDKYREEQPELKSNPTFQRLKEVVHDPSFDGDFESLDFHIPTEMRAEINGDSDECAWTKCDYYQDCYIRNMREKVKNAQVIVTNHHSLLIDATLGGKMLPPHDTVVIDEAHQLEEVATSVFTTMVKPTQVTSLLSRKKLKAHVTNDTLYATARQCEKVWGLLSQRFSENEQNNRLPLVEPIEEGLYLAKLIEKLANELTVRKPINLSEKEDDLYDKLIKRTEKLALQVHSVFKVESKQYVYYLERTTTKRNEERVDIAMVPLDVAPFLKEYLFDENNVVCVSATLASPDFDYFRQSVGATDPSTIERILPLVFNYRRNAMLYIPRDLYEPAYGQGQAARDYELAIAERMMELVHISRGRAFLLFSSRHMLETTYEHIAHKLPYTLLKQGDMPNGEMTRQFRKSKDGVLFGLKSFWEGVDIAGEALSLVVIDKLPFIPSDPVYDARQKRIEEQGEHPFMVYSLPQTILKLKQGVGRLIRTDTDRGVMAILDKRMHTKGYANKIRSALPPAIETSSLQDVEQFLAQ